MISHIQWYWEKGAGLSLKIARNFVSLMFINAQTISAENARTTVSFT